MKLKIESLYMLLIAPTMELAQDIINSISTMNLDILKFGRFIHQLWALGVVSSPILEEYLPTFSTTLIVRRPLVLCIAIQRFFQVIHSLHIVPIVHDSIKRHGVFK